VGTVGETGVRVGVGIVGTVGETGEGPGVGKLGIVGWILLIVNGNS
jgi:hypothetical protein